MRNTGKLNSEIIIKQVNAYCKKHLNSEYRDICTRVSQDLKEDEPGIFERGKAEIWSAAIVWAVGNANFLGDKSFEPYASLADICNYFNVNKSTVGQKASRIRDLLDINLWNPDYRTKNPAGDFIDSLVMTPEGFIIPANMLDDDLEEEQNAEPEDDEPTEYLVVLSSLKNVDNASLYQLEYIVRKALSAESKFIAIEKQHLKTVLITFYGTMADVVAMENKLQSSGFSIANLYYADYDNNEQ
ncbi:hypothetical protein D1164_01665 [Mariniphaga sediminis]|uniref:DUF6398 domain-containing protein n=1 Tax=Mariniphaga sediminis TaxID=1628158 RepID=A0A399DAG8_9BACT|nr:DUF6398 domain-containing protein [Mariniphaga sediminis]RIH67162.1 hypothetical protein D1164_01665 [Mariniphaga sediminis]